MAEIPINPVPPLPPSQVATPNSSTIAIPPAISNLTTGTLLNALVQGTDANGNTVLSTPNGQLTVASRFSLPTDSRLVLQVSANNVNSAGANTGNIFQARVVSVDGQPFNAQNVDASGTPVAEEAAEENQNITSQNPALSNQGVQISISSLPNNVIFNPTGSKPPGGSLPNISQENVPPTPANPTAAADFTPQNNNGLDILRVVTPAATIAGTGQILSQAVSEPVNIESSLSGLTQGETLEGVVVAPSADAGKFLPPGISGNAQQAVATIQVNGGTVVNQTAGESTQTSSLNTSDVVSFKIASAQLPGQNTATATGSGVVSTAEEPLNLPITTEKNIAAGQLPGIVIGNEKTGEPLIKTPLGNIRLDSNTPLPKGTALELEVLSVKSNPDYLSATEEQSKILSGSRTNISQAVNYLIAADPNAADKILRTTIPQLDRDFVAKLFAFINNFRQSDSPALLNQQARQILQNAGQDGLLQKMGQDFSTAKQLAADTRTNWNSVLFPVYDGKELQYGVMHYKRQSKGDNSAESSGAKFLVEVDLTRLGAIQLEGEILNKRSNKEFNLMVKTKRRLSSDLQKGITDIFIEASEITGNSGMLQFLVDKDLAPMAFSPPAGEGDNSFFA